MAGDLTGAEIAQAYVRIRPKSDGFEREVSRQVDPALRKAGKSASLTLGETLSAGAFTAFVAKVTTSAAELEQTVGGTSAVFGQYEDTISRFAAGADEAAGLSEQAARRLTSQIGGLLQGFGFTQDKAAETSVDLAQLGADLSATYGGTAPEAVQALGAALRGEFDPLERFGISLNAQIVNLKAVELGLATNTSNVSLHAKAQASLAVITERSANAHGQFGREASTAAGSAAIASAKAQNAADDLGKNFLPIYSKLAQVTGAVATGFAALPGPIQTSTVALVGMVALAGPFAKFKDKAHELAETIGAVKSESTGAAPAMDRIGKSLNSLAKAGVVAAGIASIASNLAQLKEVGEKSGTAFDEALPDPSKIDDYIASVNKGVTEYNGLVDKIQEAAGGARNVGGEWAAAGKFFLNAISGGNAFEDSIEKQSAALHGLGAKLEVSQARAIEMANRVQILSTQLGVSGTAVKNFVGQFAGLDITQVPIDKLAEAFKQAQVPGADLAKVAELLGVKVETAATKAEDSAKSFDKMRDVFFGVVDAGRAMADAEEGIVDAQRNAEESGRKVVDAQLSYQDSMARVSEAEQQRQDDLLAVVDAQEAVTKAQLDLDNALSGTSEDDALRLRSAKLRITEAELSVKEARRTKGTSKERALAVERASIALGEARLAQQQAQEDVAGRAGEAVVKLEDAQANLDGAQRTAADSADTVADAQRDVGSAAQSVRDAQRDAVEATEDIEEAQYNAAKAAIDLRDRQIELWAGVLANNGELAKLREYLIQLQTDFPNTAAAIQPYIDQLGEINKAATPPAANAVEVSPDKMDPAAFAMKYIAAGPFTAELAEKIIRARAVELGIRNVVGDEDSRMSIGSIQAFVASRSKPRFLGGPVKAGQSYAVGERNRPELFVDGQGNQILIPGDDGRVIAGVGAGTSKTVAISVTNNFQGYPTDQALNVANQRLTVLAGGF